jgi:hypothetical protein
MRLLDGIILRVFRPEEDVLSDVEGIFCGGGQWLAFFIPAPRQMLRKLNMTSPLNGNGRKFSYYLNFK